MLPILSLIPELILLAEKVFEGKPVPIAETVEDAMAIAATTTDKGELKKEFVLNALSRAYDDASFNEAENKKRWYVTMVPKGFLLGLCGFLIDVTVPLLIKKVKAYGDTK